MPASSHRNSLATHHGGKLWHSTAMTAACVPRPSAPELVGPAWQAAPCGSGAPAVGLVRSPLRPAAAGGATAVAATALASVFAASNGQERRLPRRRRRPERMSIRCRAMSGITRELGKALSAADLDDSMERKSGLGDRSESGVRANEDGSSLSALGWHVAKQADLRTESEGDVHAEIEVGTASWEAIAPSGPKGLPRHRKRSPRRSRPRAAAEDSAKEGVGNLSPGPRPTTVEALTEIRDSLVEPAHLTAEERHGRASRALRLLERAFAAGHGAKHRTKKERMASKRKSPAIPSRFAAEVLATIASQELGALEVSLDAFKVCVSVLSLEDLASVGLWSHLAEASPRLRIILCNALVSKDASAGGEVGSSWAQCGVTARDALNACAELADSVLARLETLPEPFIPKPKIPRGQKLKLVVKGPFVRKSAVPDDASSGDDPHADRKGYRMARYEERLWSKAFVDATRTTYLQEAVQIPVDGPAGEDVRASQPYDIGDVDEAAQVCQLLHYVALVVATPSLQTPPESALDLVVGSAEALSLARYVATFGVSPNAGGLLLLDQLLADMSSEPCRYSEDVLLPLAATSLPSRPPAGASCSPVINAVGDRLAASLGRALSVRWQALGAVPGRSQLLVCMQRLPSLIQMHDDAWVSDPRLQAVLSGAYEECPHVLRTLPSAGLVALMKTWSAPGAPPVPLPVQWILPPALERHLLSLDARSLSLASQLVEESCDWEWLSTFWRRWAQQAVLDRSQTGWGKCIEALREVQQWRDKVADGDLTRGGASRSDASGLAHHILQATLTPVLADVLEDAPVDLLLLLDVCHDAEAELSQNAGEQSLRRRLATEIEIRARRAFAGSAALPGDLPISLAVAIAGGQTPVKCERGTELWEKLVTFLVAKLSSSSQVDFFSRCHPSLELWEDVLQAAERAASESGSGEQWRSLELRLRRPPPVEWIRRP